MNYFTYRNYIKNIHTLKLNNILKVAEEEEGYSKEKFADAHSYKSIIEIILKDKVEVAKFLSDYLKAEEKITSEEIEEYTEIVNSKNIIYKSKKTDIYFVIQCSTRCETS